MQKFKTQNTMKNITVEILVGLPASGKSSHATKRQKASNYKTLYVERVDYENLQLQGLRHFNRLTLLEKVEKEQEHYDWWKTHGNVERQTCFVLDGLFLELSYIQEIVARWRQAGVENFKVIVFNGLTETLLKNDKLRRIDSKWNPEKGEHERFEVSCEHSIRNKNLPKGLREFCEENNIQIEFKPAPQVKDWELFYRWLKFKDFYEVAPESYQNSCSAKTKENEICIASWCVGGTSGSCYDESEEDLEILEEQPEPKIEETGLGEILKDFVPLKDLAALCYVPDEIYSVGDYYGGSQENKVKIISVPKIFKLFCRHNKWNWEKLPEISR